LKSCVKLSGLSSIILQATCLETKDQRRGSWEGKPMALSSVFLGVIMGQTEDINTLNLITRKFNALENQEDVGVWVREILDESVLSEQALKVASSMAPVLESMMKAGSPQTAQFLLATAYTMGFVTGVEFNKIRRTETPPL
jgi:hypothetical protein